MEKIVAYNLTKKEKDFSIIDEVSFTVHEGEILALVGQEHSGKTLVTKLIQSISRINSGNAAINGHDTAQGLRDTAQTTGVFIDAQNFYNEKNCYETLEHNARLLGKRFMHTQAMNILNLLGLKKVKSVPLYLLNPSQMIRLKLAVALIAMPNILILDEPFKSLTEEEAREVRKILKTLADDFDVAILITARDFSGVEEIFDTAAIIDDGMIVSVKSYNELVRQNAPYTKVGISTPMPNSAARFIEQTFGYETHLCGSDVIVDTLPDKAQMMYEELTKNKITVYGMTRINKSIGELLFDLVKKRQGE